MIHMFVYYFTCYASMSYKNKLILCETYIHASSRMGFSPPALLFSFVLEITFILGLFIFLCIFQMKGTEATKLAAK